MPGSTPKASRADAVLYVAGWIALVGFIVFVAVGLIVVVLR